MRRAVQAQRRPRPRSQPGYLRRYRAASSSSPIALAKSPRLGTGALNADSKHRLRLGGRPAHRAGPAVFKHPFSQRYVFAGTAVDAPPFVATCDSSGAITSVAYAGNTLRATVEALRRAPASSWSSAATNAGPGIFNHLVCCATRLRQRQHRDRCRAVRPSSTARDRSSRPLAEHGGVQTRIESNLLPAARSGVESEQPAPRRLTPTPSTIVRLQPKPNRLHHRLLQWRRASCASRSLDYIK